ncbi:MAG TPA: flagellar biosynthesis protein FlhF [Campylobacterales bacterium]|nr:flagellar biosynthesis protein FlhF [Campylobacterales bacterium]
MNIKKVQGSSVQEAIRKAKLIYGDDISVIETKKLKSGIFGGSLHEVVISLPKDSFPDGRKSRFQQRIEQRLKKGFDLRIDTSIDKEDGEYEDILDFKFKETPEEIPLLSEKSEKPKGANPYNRVIAKPKIEDTHVDVSENAKKILELARKRQKEQGEKKNIKTSSTTPISSKPHDRDALSEIKTEISQLNDKIKLIQNMFWEEKNPGINIPPEFSEIYKIAKQSGMNQEHIDMIMKLSIQHMPLKMRQNSETVKRYFKALLRKMIPVRAETLIKPPNKKIVMFVGATGVGKTTTIAKLTARFALKSDREYKVGLIVLDTYKIGAVEQLTQYARMMKVPIETVVSPADFADKLERMSSQDYIFIDTMGSSPYDVEKIESIKEFLETGKYAHEIEVMLVLPSSLKYEDLLENYNSFSKLNIDTIIFTKLDETKGFGNIFSLIHDIQKPISYFSIGQEVPEDLIVAKSEFLVESLLHGFKRDRVDDNF